MMQTAILLIMLAGTLAAETPSAIWRETFDSLDSWQAIDFPKIAQHSTYALSQDGTNRVLKTESQASASAFVSRHSFDVRATPWLAWRWKVENVYPKADSTRKEGDDYPLRLYVLFEYDPSKATLWEKTRYGAARLIYGKYPPHSTLNYVWASKTPPARNFASPYTDRAQLIALRSGPGQLKEWVTERVNIVEDYRKAFGRDPPPLARLGIMNDSDNTGEQAVSYLDDVEISAATP